MIIRRAFLALAFEALFSLTLASLQAQTPARDQHVILISVDGLAHYYFEDPKAPMPTIRKLAAESARAKKMKTSLPTVTWPNHGCSPANRSWTPVSSSMVLVSSQGVVLDTISNTDVAPTAAHLLGVELKNVDGKVLAEVLK